MAFAVVLARYEPHDAQSTTEVVATIRNEMGSALAPAYQSALAVARGI